MSIFDLKVGAYFVFADSPYQVARVLSNDGFSMVEYEYTAAHLHEGSGVFRTDRNYEVKELVPAYQ